MTRWRIGWLAYNDSGENGLRGRGGESDLFVTVVVDAVIVAKEAVTKNPQWVALLVLNVSRSKDDETNRQRAKILWNKFNF